MRSRTSAPETAESAETVVSDTLSASLVLLVLAQLLQRSVGLGRNILFCGMLSDQELGRWSLMFNFLMLAAPLVVLGLPGSFGRYVEHYRGTGQLKSFLRRTGIITLGATLLAGLLIVVFPSALARFIFDDPSQHQLVRLLCISLAAVIGFNFLVELFTAMRLVRFASTLQLLSSLGFALGGAAILYLTPLRESGVLLAYGAASLVAFAFGLWLLRRCWRALPESQQPLRQRTMWAKLVPFAGWVWAANLIGNLFEVADQFMLKHLSGLEAAQADALIGQYYSSRVIPVLLVALATLSANSLLPHLTHDWEAGRRGLVRQRLRLSVKLAAMLFTAAAAGVLLLAPILFVWILGGRYATGMSVLPGTLVYCIWFGMTCIAMCYLLCAEVARLGSVALFCGLVANVALNYLLAPVFGLYGVIAATVAANAVALSLVLVTSQGRGMRWGWGTWLACTLPLTLLLGGLPALAIVGLVSWVSLHGGWVLETDEIKQLTDFRAQLRDRFAWLSLPSRSERLEEAQC